MDKTEKLLYDKHPQLMFWIEQVFSDDELPPEPSEEELELINRNAEELLADFLEEDDDECS